MSHVPAETWRGSAADQAYWQKLIQLGRRRLAPKGTLLYVQGEVSPLFYLILTGQVECALAHPDGAGRILDIVGPGNLIGEASAFDGEPRYTTATVVRRAEVVELHVKTVEEAIELDPKLAMALIRSVSHKHRRVATFLEDSTFFDAYGRVCRLLTRLMENYGGPADRGVAIRVRLTHEQIANLTGTTRVTVSRVMNQLRRRGIIDTGGAIVILDPKGLAEPRGSQT